VKRETTPKPIQSVEPRLIESKNPKITLRLVSKFFSKNFKNFAKIRLFLNPKILKPTQAQNEQHRLE